LVKTVRSEHEPRRGEHARIVADHEALAEAVAAGDAEAAERAVTEHIRGFYALLHGNN
jgi:DNA-binding FadR family transcriptional regulator